MLQKAIIFLLILTALLIVYSGLLIAGVFASPSVDAVQTIIGGLITLVVALLGYILRSFDRRLAAMDGRLLDMSSDFSSRLAAIEERLLDMSSDFSSRLARVEATLEMIKSALGLK